MGTRLLVVDDNADMRTSLKLALELAGYEVEVAANGREALALQRNRPADVVITDLFMPDADGFEAIDGLRRQFPQARIVAISGDARFTKRDYLPDAKLLGVDATLQKPFEMSALLKTLQSFS